MYVTRKVGPKGQVVIPDELRARFGMTPGVQVRFDSTADAVIIARQKTADEVMAAFRAIREKPSLRKAPTVKDMEKWFEEA
jgi:AbrB family looped-hinge helix DNA binding protein